MKVHRLLKIATNGLWLTAGTAFILLAFEAAFRVAGIFFPAPAKKSSENDEHVILCEGDSFTFGIGGIAYPYQMEGILNNRSTVAGFRVINNSIPASNGAMIYKRLVSDIPKIRPDTVIVIAGDVNRWNPAALDPADFRWQTKLDKFLLNFRIYKFCKLLYSGFRHADFSAFQEIPEKRYMATAGDKNRKIQADFGKEGRDPSPRETRPQGTFLPWGRYANAAGEAAIVKAADSAAIFFRKGALDKAVDGVITALESAYLLDHPAVIATYRFDNQPVLREILTAAKSLDPDSEKVLFALGEYKFRSALLKESIGYFKLSLQKHPRSARSYAGLAMCLMDRHDMEEAYRFVQKALAIRPYDFNVRMAVGRYHLNRMDYPRAAGEILKLPGDKRFLIQNFIPEIYLRAKDIEKAAAFALKVKKEERWASTWLTLGLYWDKKGEDEKAFKTLEDGLRYLPEATMIGTALLRHLLSRGENLQKLLEYGKTIPEFKYCLHYEYFSKLVRDSQRTKKHPLFLLSEMAWKDILKIYKLTRKYRVRLIFASYPDIRFQEVEKVVKEHKIRYINFKKLFQKAFISKTEFTAPNGRHCNTVGYKYMAEVLADEVLHPERSFDPESVKP
ncbi:MAG: hypothetical protein ABIG11_01285 [bacterium]